MEQLNDLGIKLPFKPNPGDERAEPLTREEAQKASDVLYKNVDHFPRVNRKFIDPPRPCEPKFALFSFTPPTSFIL